MAQNYYYAYAEIDPTTNMCIGVHSGTSEMDNPYFVRIPEYDENYVFKYYIDGAWYEDSAGTVPYNPA